MSDNKINYEINNLQLYEKFQNLKSFEVIETIDSNVSLILILNLKFELSEKKIVLRQLKDSLLGQHSAEKRQKRFDYILDNYNKTPQHVKILGFLEDNNKRSSYKNNYQWIIEEYISGITFGEYINKDKINLRFELTIKDISNYILTNQNNTKKCKKQAIYVINEMIVDDDGVVNVFDLYRESSRYPQISLFEQAILKHSHELKNSINDVTIISHGDFHPWNIMLTGSNITTMDRSRSLFNHPANDVGCIIINLIVQLILSDKINIKEYFIYAIKNIWIKCISESKLKNEILIALIYFSCSRLPAICCPKFYPGIKEINRKSLLSTGISLLTRDSIVTEDNPIAFIEQFKIIFCNHGGNVTAPPGIN